MRTFLIVVSLLFSLTFAVASLPDTRLGRRANQVIVEECSNVNNATDDLYDTIMAQKSALDRRPGDVNTNEVVNAFSSSNDVLIRMLYTGATNIQKGQGDVTPTEADDVMTLREAYALQIQNITKIVGQDGVFALLGLDGRWAMSFSDSLRGQRNASDKFSSTVVSKMPISLRGVLNKWHSESQDSLDDAIRNLVQLTKIQRLR